MDSKNRSELQTFAAKVGIVMVAITATVWLSALLIENKIVSSLEILKGGPKFWKQAEFELAKLAYEPDLPPKKKEQIIATLQRLAKKYRPYVDALTDDADRAPSR